MALLDGIGDPDHVADVYWSGIPGYVAEGFFEDARRYAVLHDEATSELTPHHRLHGVAFLLEVEELAAGWDTIRDLTPRVEAAVENVATPCVHNPRSLLVSALAHACLGDGPEAARLEELADSLGTEEYGRVFDTRIRLALLRHELDAVERLCASRRRHEGRSFAARSSPPSQRVSTPSPRSETASARRSSSCDPGPTSNPLRSAPWEPCEETGH